MATVASVPADRRYIVAQASGQPNFPTYLVAEAAALLLSIAAGNAPHYVGKVEEVVTAPGRVDLVPGVPGPQVWIVTPVSGTTFLPKSAAEQQAFIFSAGSANAPNFIARVFQTVAGPA